MMMTLPTMLFTHALLGALALASVKPWSPQGLPLPRHSLQGRQGQRCGSGNGRCPSGQCCSESGYCGMGQGYCEGSQCQLDYSDGCDTFKAPPGESTRSVPRPLVGSVPYGSVINACTQGGTIALTFDDGPLEFTTQLLDLLDDREVKATFFVAGNNRGKGRIDDDAKGWKPVLQRMHDAGHHIASHTWTHRNLNQVNASVRTSEMVYNEMALRNIFGFIPTYMRPPYLECGAASGCTTMMRELGYHVIENNIDTKDYENDDAALIQNSRDRFASAVSKANPDRHSYIVLAHDVHYQTVVNLTAYMIQVARERGYRLTTVGDCLGDPEDNWYREAGSAAATTASAVSGRSTIVHRTGTTSYSKPSRTAGVSKDQTCGGVKGQTCRGSDFGDCCSYYGWCGSGPEYCGTGCDPNFGSCHPLDGGIMNTTNGLCGARIKASCENFGDKTCCSQYGYCGNSTEYCGKGCQKGYGNCD